MIGSIGLFLILVVALVVFGPRNPWHGHRVGAVRCERSKET